MTLQDTGILMSLALALVALGKVFYMAGVEIAGLKSQGTETARRVTAMETFTRALNQMEVKVDTIWDFQMRRAESEAMIRGIASHRSPLEVSAEAKGWMQDLAQDLRDFYRQSGYLLTEKELALAIEQQYGDEMLHKVCIPHGLLQGACLLIAMAVAKEGHESAAPAVENPESPGAV